MDNDTLKTVLSDYGEIEDAFIIKKRKRRREIGNKGNLRNIGYVIFKNEEDAVRFRKKKKINTEVGVIKIKEFDPGEKRLSDGVGSNNDSDKNKKYEKLEKFQKIESCFLANFQGIQKNFFLVVERGNFMMEVIDLFLKIGV